MIMGWHQAISQNFYQVRLEIFLDLTDEKNPVGLTEEYRLAVYTPVIKMVVLTFCQRISAIRHGYSGL
jgi:hypothetical protein